MTPALIDQPETKETVNDFQGTVHLAKEPDSQLKVIVSVNVGRITIRAGDAELGSWKHEDVTITRSGDVIHLTADDETLILSLAQQDSFLDLLGVNEAETTPRPRRKKPVMMPDPPPPAPRGSRAKYVADDALSSSFDELRRQAAASYPDDTKLNRSVALALAGAAVMVLVGSFLTWGSIRLLDPGSFPLERALTGVAGLAAAVGAYLAYFDRRRVIGSALALSAGVAAMVVVYMYARSAHLGLGFILTALGALTLAGLAGWGISSHGAAARKREAG